MTTTPQILLLGTAAQLVLHANGKKENPGGDDCYAFANCSVSEVDD